MPMIRVLQTSVHCAPFDQFSVNNSLQGNQSVGKFSYIDGLAFEGNGFEAVVMVQMDMLTAEYEVVKLMLYGCEPFLEV